MSIGAELETDPVSSIFSTRKNESEIVNCSINRVKRELNHKMCMGVAREVPTTSTIFMVSYIPGTERVPGHGSRSTVADLQKTTDFLQRVRGHL